MNIFEKHLKKMQKMEEIDMKLDKQESQSTFKEIVEELRGETHTSEVPKTLPVLVIKGVEIDLRRLDIHFYPNSQQLQVLDTLIDFFNQKNFGEYTLEGYAGTGKTSIIKILLEYFWIVSKFKSFTLTAPTHRAKAVMEQLSKKTTSTLHSLLGLYPDLELEKIDMNNLSFDTKNPQGMLIMNGNLIIDESSMINDDLKELIEQKCREFNVRVLFIGDPAQLKPVKQLTISKVFLNTQRSVLTKVERQSDDNPIHYLLDNLRLDNPEEIEWNKVSNIIGDEGKEKGLYVTSSSIEFIDHLKDQFGGEEFKKNKLYTRVLAYTNKKVGVYNNLVRQVLGYKDSFSEGELLMAYDNHNSNNPLQKIINSCDYVILKSEKKFKNVNGTNLIGNDLKLLCLQTNATPSIFLLDSSTPADEREKLGEELEFLRQEGISGGGRAWMPYYELKDSFCSTFNVYCEDRVVKKKLFDYGYSHTVHKSQGGTLNNVMIDVKDILGCQDPQLKQQLLYVALSRCTNVSICLAPSVNIEEV